MAGIDKRSSRRVPVALRIKLRYADVDAFVEKFATNVSRGGMFIASRTPKPIDTLLRFELLLADGSPVIAGEGVVRWIREFDADQPRRPHGMGIEFGKLSAASQTTLDRILDQRRARGLDEEAIPLTPKRARPPEPEPAPQPPADEPAATAPEPEPVPAPAPPAAPRARPTATVEPAPAADLSWSDEALAALLDGADAAPALQATLARARDIAYSGAGLDADVDELLKPAAAPTASSVSDASAALAAMTGAPAVAPRPTDEPDGDNGQSGPARAEPPTADAEPREVADAEVADAEVADAAEDGDPPTLDPYAEPDPYIEPADDDEHDAPPPLEALDDAQPPALDADDELAIGTPPPAETPVEAEPEPEVPPTAEAEVEVSTGGPDYGGNDEATFVQAVLPDAVLDEPDPSPLPPPTDDGLLEHTPPPLAAADDPLSHELSVDAMDADDLLASGLDELPTGGVQPLELEDDDEYPREGYTQEGPTNVVDSEALADEAPAAEDEIDLALASLGLESEEATAVKEPGAGDGEDLDEHGGDGELDDDPENKKGFFKRIFGK